MPSLGFFQLKQLYSNAKEIKQIINFFCCIVNYNFLQRPFLTSHADQKEVFPIHTLFLSLGTLATRFFFLYQVCVISSQLLIEPKNKICANKKKRMTGFFFSLDSSDTKKQIFFSRYL
jgi:hypothetical protein